jgi:chromosome segregation ATPase
MAVLVINKSVLIPGKSDVDFDDLNVLAPIIRHLAKPTLDSANARIKVISAKAREAKETGQKLAAAIRRLEHERDATDNPHWKEAFGLRITRLLSSCEKWQAARVHLEATAARLEERANILESEVKRIERYRGLVNEADSLLSSKGHAVRFDLSDLEHKLLEVRTTVGQADTATSTYMAARAEMEAEHEPFE